MRVLLIHNYYRSASPSGEDIVFESERQLLEDNGHDVSTYARNNDDIGTSFMAQGRAIGSLFWSRQALDDIDRLIVHFKPDIAHFHNTFPLISASGYRACQNRGVPVVQTLHNYRLICPGALLLRGGRPCEKCIEGSLINSIRHACYRDSVGATTLVSAMLTINRQRNIYSTDVDRYICLTEFARARFIRGGLPQEKLIVRSNALVDPPLIGDGSGNYALYVGRLAEEKGVRTLLQAWHGITQLPLKIVGEGPLGEELRKQARAENLNVDFLGRLPRTEIFRLMQQARMLIIPSEWYEGFPVTAMEGMACGTPMIVSALGALDEILTAPAQCLKFEAGNADDLRTSVINLNQDGDLRNRMRAANRNAFDHTYSPKHALTSLLGIYEQTIMEREQRHLDARQLARS